MPVLTGLRAVPPAARWRKSTPMEFLHGRPLGPEEIEMLRRQIEEGFDNIDEVDDEIRGIVVRNWPALLSKLPPKDERSGGWVVSVGGVFFSTYAGIAPLLLQLRGPIYPKA